MAIDKYVDMLSNFYAGGTSNHEEHDSNPDYLSILLKSIVSSKEKFDGKKFLDFGCGKGRNIKNAISLANWSKLDGVDISQNNIDYCKKIFSDSKHEFWKNNGSDLSDLESNKYHFVMSTIVLQHICVHELRFKLLKEIHRVMASGGLFSFQMGFGDISYNGSSKLTKYYDNNYDAASTNGGFDVQVDDPEYLVNDLKLVGFKDITYVIRPSWSDGGHSHWIYVEAYK